MNEDEAYKLAKAYIDCCHSGFEGRIGEVFSEDSYIFDSATGRTIAPDSLIEDVRLLRRAFPHVRFELTQWALCDDQNLMLRWRLVKNSIPAEILEKLGGLKEDYTGVDFLVLSDKKVVQTQSYLDRSGETLEYFARRINREMNDLALSQKKAGADKQEMSDRLIFENLEKLMNVDRVYLNSKIRINQLAKSIGVNSNHLSRIVNQLSGQNFNDFVNGYRIADAKLLMEDHKRKNGNAHSSKKLPMGQISLQCGFNSQSVFNAVFKSKTGMTPLKYRELIQSCD